jgi:NTP pyrophosphatase (non-canonical NTP hydrolase)
MDVIQALADRLSDFVAARDWAQFHTPKNLAMALAGEAGELIAEFQWLTPEESASIMTADPEAAQRILSELADVTIYLVRLASVLDVDLVAAAHAKIDQNEVRYRPDAYRGSARKAPPATETAADRGH